MKLPTQPPSYNPGFEQQRSGIIERAFSQSQSLGALSLVDGIPAPEPFGDRAVIYVDSADGDLKIVFADGTVKTIVTD